MKTPDEIFNWLTRNCSYFFVLKNHEDVKKLVRESKKDDGITLVCAVNNIPNFHADYDAFVEFLGEPYSFKKHLEPLVKQKLIDWSHAVTTDEHKAVVADYQTPNHKRYIQFWIGVNPYRKAINDALDRALKSGKP